MKRTLNARQDGYIEPISIKEFRKEARQFNEDWRKAYDKLFPFIPVNFNTLTELNQLVSTYVNLANYADSAEKEAYQKVLYRHLEPKSEEDKNKLRAVWSLRQTLSMLIERKI